MCFSLISLFFIVYYIQSTWSTIRSSFHPLTPGQIGRVLDGYHVPTHKMIPSWKNLNGLRDEKTADVGENFVDLLILDPP